MAIPTPECSCIERSVLRPMPGPIGRCFPYSLIEVVNMLICLTLPNTHFIYIVYYIHIKKETDTEVSQAMFIRFQPRWNVKAQPRPSCHQRHVMQTTYRSSQSGPLPQQCMGFNSSCGNAKFIQFEQAKENISFALSNISNLKCSGNNPYLLSK